MNELDKLYVALKNATAAADAGDKNAAEDARQIASHIKELEAQAEEDYANPTVPTAAGAVIGGAKGLRDIPEKMVGSAAEQIGEKLASAVTPSAAPAAPAAAPAAPSYTSPHGFHPGATSNAEFNLQQAQANPLKRAATEVPGFHNPGNSRLILPTTVSEESLIPKPAPVVKPDLKTLAKAKALEKLKAAPGATLEKVPGVAIAPNLVGGALTGWNATQAYNAAKEGRPVEATISGAGAVAPFVGTLSKNPKTKGLGLLLGGGAAANRYIQEKRREEAQEKARGGLVGYAGGKKVVESGLDVAKKLFAPKQTRIVRASEALGPHEGKYLNLTQSDRMRSTGGDLGGPGFSKFQLENPDYAGAAWGVGNKPTASGIVNINKRYPEGKAIWAPMIGSEGQHRSNQHVYDALTDEFNRQASMGNLPSELRQAMNARLASAPKYSHLGLNEIDVANPEHIKQMGNTFDRRAAISEVLGGEGVGGRKGQIFDYSGVMQEMTDPMTIGAPTHSMGTRLFTLNNEIEHRPDLHSAFPFILKGEDMGVAFNPVPKELAYPSWLNMAKEFTGREPGYMELTRGIKGQGKPHQFIDEKYLRALEEAGHKEGGSTTPAWQRKEGKNPEGGLNAAGRASYNRETGGNLKAPQPEGGPRKDSFCARMEGMKKKLTSAKTANDPDSRINKSLRKWKC